jgi:N-acetylglucosamine-6-phosphate deacetylase
VHLPDAFVRAATRAKGVQRSLLVTDASAPACCAPGRYKLGEQDVELTGDGRVVLAGPDGQRRLAGSALRMDEALGNVMRAVHLPLADAVSMATVNPAGVARIRDRQQGLIAGERADLVRFRFDAASHRVRVEETWVSGACLFRRRGGGTDGY